VQGELLPVAKNAVRTEAILRDSLAVLDGVWRATVDTLHGAGVDALRTRQLAAMTAMGRWAYRAALARPESRGMHYRADHPDLDASRRHRILTGGLDNVWTKIDPEQLDTSLPAELLPSAS